MPLSDRSKDDRGEVAHPTQVQEALPDAEQQFRTLADGIPQLAWMARPDGWLFWYNQRWYDYTGTTLEQMEGWGWRDVHDPAELDRVMSSWQAALRSGEPWDDTFPLRRHDGEMRWHLSRAMPVRDESGTIVRWFGTNTDITERRRAVEELARLKEESDQRRRVYEAALASTPDLIYVFDLDHRFTFANQALLAMWGKSWDEAIGKTCLELGYPQWHAEMHDREIEQVIATKRPIRGEVPFNSTGGRRVYDYIFSPVLGADGEVVAVAGSTRDVTERQQAEQAIREQAEQLREADRRKDEFLATLGHELRNPLASIVNAAEAMARDREHKSDGEMLEIVERQARHMSRLIDDLLDVARIARGKILLRAERLDFAEIVRETAEDHRREVEDAGLMLAVEILNRSLWVSGDRTRLAQVVGNLLHNAAKFTDSGGRIEVSLALERQQAVLRIRDSGLGMSAEMLARIFVPFNQADASLARSRGGLGLGLALVKGLVELHGGTVAAKSEGLGSGSEFLIRLPLTSLTENASTEQHDGGHERTQLRILAIDDRRDILRPMQVLLTRDGHVVELVTDGRAGFDAARRLMPDVVICDIGLPGEMNGHDVARALRQTPETTATFLIALTGYGQESDRQAALAAGFDLHLTKPIDIRALRTVLAGVTPNGRS
ncbi:MAG: PAS domain-containing protein [Planctomycetota bacterium]|nr:PAS domain-containing protein [Planctomycetaceae bacterium]MDQ3330928.1 PAS domain-containing protein [Planctomycetota bacterium]